MKQKTKDTIGMSITGGIIVLLIVGVVWSICSENAILDQRNEYCGELFPSPLEEKDNLNRKLVWGELVDVENGYIRCCRRYSENHEIKKECEIFHEGTLAVGEQ